MQKSYYVNILIVLFLVRIIQIHTNSMHCAPFPVSKRIEHLRLSKGPKGRWEDSKHRLCHRNIHNPLQNTTPPLQPPKKPNSLESDSKQLDTGEE